MSDKSKGSKQHPPPAGSHAVKTTNHGGVDRVSQKPGVHDSVKKPKAR
jgi:hypothetical protein